MGKNQVLSSLDIANWFCKKAETNHLVFGDLKIQQLLFLAQFCFVQKFKKFLYPSLSVCNEYGFYDPAIRTILSFGLPLMRTPDLSSKTEDLLNFVWQKYALMDEQKLHSFIISLDCWKRSFRPEEETIVNLLSFFQETPNKSLLSDKPKIMISQNGPVKVSAWQPRKLSSSNK